MDNVFRTIAQDLNSGRTLYGVQMKETADVFKLMDRDGSETIDAAELGAALSRLEMRLSAEQLRAVLEAVDQRQRDDRAAGAGGAHRHGEGGAAEASLQR